MSMGANKYCRIAIGQDSQRGLVDKDFKVILVADQTKVDRKGGYYDPPLLNRFEKQYLDSNDIWNEE